MAILFATEMTLSTGDVMCLFDAAEFPGPTGQFDSDQIEAMINHANVIVTARANGELVGAALAMANFSSVCFLVAFVVHPDHQGEGVGAELLRLSRIEGGGDEVSFVTVSTPNAVGFYESAGMEKCENGFIIPRRR